jgi:isohexenylglutaconyl-CoA hydratase
MTVAPASGKTLLTELQRGVLKITINRPDARNALSDEVVDDLEALVDALVVRDDIRVVTLRGAGGTFCAGGDIRSFRALTSSARPADGVADPFLTSNLRFGELLLRWNSLPQVTLALIEGAVFGGGLGLACAVDLSLATRDARFAVSETRLGVVPAQIGPFLVARIGISAARKTALTGRSFDGVEAKAIGLVDELYADGAALEAGCDALIDDILKCAPGALATTKALLLRTGTEPVATLMRDAANIFVTAARSGEGREGVAAFLEKRPPAWSVAAGHFG